MGKASSVKSLNVNSSAELLSYIINQDPILSENIDLPVQRKFNSTNWAYHNE